MAAERLPEYIGRYRIQARLGCGGMAEVFLAEWEAFAARRPVALKRLLPHLATDSDYVQLLQREIACCANLEHEHIVRLYDAGDDDGAPFLVLEYIDGGGLHELLSAGPLAPETVAWMGAQLCRALAYAHHAQTPVVHRDISPHNILVSHTGLCKLTDFGIAKLTGNQTRTRNLRGKLAYMAPEQLREHITGPASDQYALGLVLYEAACNRRAYANKAETALIADISANRWCNDDDTWQNLPEALRALIAGMLAAEPKARHPDLAITADALQEQVKNPVAAIQELATRARVAARSRTETTTTGRNANTPTLTLPRWKRRKRPGIFRRHVAIVALPGLLLSACGPTAGGLAPDIWIVTHEKRLRPAQVAATASTLRIEAKGPSPVAVTAPISAGQLQVDHLLPGRYNLMISAVTDGGEVPFAGTATADVQIGKITPIRIQLEGRFAP